MADVPEHVQREAEQAEQQSSTGSTTVATLARPPALTREERLATVIRQGSIQDLRVQPTDKVNVWPHLLVIEFVACLVVLSFLLIFSIFVNAPFEELANPNHTPEVEKAPWYFLGLQELLEYFTPMVAGVLAPGMAATMLILIPFIDKNPGQRPEDRKFAVSLFTMFLMFWAILTITGIAFRGPGFQFVLPWKAGWFTTL